MKNKNYYIGKKYGNFEIIEIIGEKKWSCGRKTHIVKGKCLQCGNIHQQNLNSVRAKKPKYCLLCKKQSITTHGKHDYPIYRIWQQIKDRCNNKNNPHYNRYGGRGITYDKNWNIFKNFFQDMGSTWKNGLTIERINNNGNYCKENCKWTTRYEQCQNRCNTVFIEYKGQKKSLSQWAKELKMPFDTLAGRYYRKWPIDKMLNK